MGLKLKGMGDRVKKSFKLTKMLGAGLLATLVLTGCSSMLLHYMYAQRSIAECFAWVMESEPRVPAMPK